MSSTNSLASTVSYSTAATTATTTTSNFLPNKTIYLDVSPTTTEAGLQQYLFGHITRVYIPKNKYNQSSRGFAFITFRSHDKAVTTMEELEGSKSDGLILHPRWAAPRKKVDVVKTKRNGSRKKGSARINQTHKV
jgi:hypothetical protein